MVGGVSIIHVGGFTETEMKEKKDRVDDALNATKAALEGGIIPGGGSALLFARESITAVKYEPNSDISVGYDIVYKSCGAPFKTILTNAGYEEDRIQSLILQVLEIGDGGTKTQFGYDLKTQTISNMKELGIIDPTKVCKSALQNAASVAGNVLLTEAVVFDLPSDDKEIDPMMGMM
jgi:chaperonin GroEL